MSGSITEIIVAIRSNDLAGLRKLVSGGADITVVSSTKRTLLHLAAEEGSVAMVRFLLECGLPVDAQAEDGSTALHIAASMGKAGIPTLITRELEWTHNNPRDRLDNVRIHPEIAKAFTKIVEQNDPSLSDDLRDAIEAEPERSMRYYCLVYELMNKPANILTQLQSAGVDVESLDPFFADVLAGSPRYMETVASLLDRGANMDAFDASGRTPLHNAVMMSELPMVELLVKRGANPNMRQEGTRSSSESPVDTALDFGRIEIVRFLHANGGKVDFPGSYPLHVAAGNGRLEIVNWLLACGAKIDEVNPNGNTPLMTAADRGHADIVKALCGSGGDILAANKRMQTVVHLAANYHECLQPLMELHLDLDQQDVDGMTPLHYAAVGLEVDSVRILAKAGASLNLKNNDGNTPLHIVFFGDELRPDIEFPVFEVLVEVGVERNVRNNQGQTAHDIAKAFNYPSNYLDLLRPIQ